MSVALEPVTVKELKQELEVRSDSTEKDALLTAITKRARALIEDELQRCLVYPGSNYTETFDIEHGSVQTLRLGDAPVITVASVHEDPAREYGSDTLLTEGTDYLIDKKTGELRRITGQSLNYWYPGFLTVRVVFSAGYVHEVDGSGDLSTDEMPPAIKDVALRWGAMTFREIMLKEQGRAIRIDHNANQVRTIDPKLASTQLTDAMREQLAPYARLSTTGAYVRRRA